MTEPNSVCSSLVSSGVFPDFTAEELLPFCLRAVDWLSRHLKDDADSNSALALKTAEAVARYNIFTSRIGITESYGSFKVGDMTLKRDVAKEYEIEKALYTEALCDAAEILKDGGFCFVSG